jgi:hypothetical protein
MRMTIKRVAFISDLQVPFFNEAAVKSVGKFLTKWHPHQTICIGDEIDLPQLGGFNAGTIDEMVGNINDDRIQTQQVLSYLGVTDVLGSNHGIRLYRSIKKRLPSFLNLPELQYEKFMGYDKLGIKFRPYGYDWAHGWTAVHGDAFPLSQVPGQTALNGARRLGKSVVCGHTHRLGQSAFTEASRGQLGRTVWGVEVGMLVDLSSTGMAYTRGYANWQTGFAVAYVQERRVQIVTVPINTDGSFIFEGKLYK